jgi:hypothetical protein
VLGNDLLSWDAERTIEPPPTTRHDQLRLDDEWSAEGLRDPRPRSVWPDAVLGAASNSSPTGKDRHSTTGSSQPDGDDMGRLAALTGIAGRVLTTWAHTWEAAPSLVRCEHDGGACVARDRVAA